MENSDQIFFGAGERDIAEYQAIAMTLPLFAVIDKRSKKPKPLMFVVGSDNVFSLSKSEAWKRMWTSKLAAVGVRV